MKYLSLVLIAVFLSGCAIRQNDKNNSALAIRGAAFARGQESMRKIFGERSLPFVIGLSELSSEGDRSKKTDQGIKARGLGGTVLPLFLEINGIEVLKREPMESGYRLEVELDATVNGIPPKCGKVNGLAVVNDDGTASLEFPNFYCNWILIGNVFVNMKLSINSIDIKNDKFSGYYSLRFIGTGNAGGSGDFTGKMMTRGL